MRLLLLLAALLVCNGTPARAAPAREAAWTPVPLGALGLDAYIQRKWREPSLTLRYRTRIDRMITAARLRLQLTPTHLDGITKLTIRLNGVRVAELTAAELTAGYPREIALDARLITPNNELTFALSGPRSCVAAGAWGVLSPASALEVHEVRLRGRGGLNELPLPFFDRLLDSDVEVPFVFAEAPSPNAVRAAFVLAGGFALATRAEVRFPVSVGALPAGNAVVVGTPEQLAALGVTSGGLVDNPRGAGQLLVALAEDAELATVAEALAERLTRHAPGLGLQLGHLVPLSSLAPPDRLMVRGRRDGEIVLDFSLPPAAVFWRDAGLPVTLLLEEAMARDAPSAKLAVLLNGEYVTTLKRGRGSGVRQARFRLPQPLLKRHNRLVISRELEPSESCPAPHPDEYFAVGGDSTLDLRRATQIATLPDLGQLASSGFPFTRAADLAETTIVLPDVPSPRALAVLLGIAGRLARLGGKPALAASFVPATELEVGLDRDLIVVGAAGAQPILSRWRERMPATIGDDGAPVLRRDGLLAEWQQRLLDHGGERALSLARLGTSAHPGLIASFESPLKRGRTVLVVTARDDEGLPDPGVIDQPALRADRPDLVLVSDGKSAAFGVGPRYVVGRMGWFQRQLWYLSLRPYLLVLFLLLSAWWLARGVIGRAAPRARARLLLVLLLFAAAGSARADTPVPADLAGRARFWEAQGRVDKAAEIWQQLLRLDPDSEIAQAGLSRCHAPQPAAVDEALDRSLSGARALAADGRYQEAMVAYRKVLGPRPPARLALEYYETLAGTADGRAEAETALAELARAHPDTPELALAHARTLTYDERTRPTGMAELARLVTVPQVAREAQAALERARSWSEASGSARGDALKLGYAALNEGNPEHAAEIFTRALVAAPRDVEALVGLSWVRIKQSRFVEARTLAEKAQKEAPQRKLWHEPLRVASLWSALAEAATDLERRDFGGAARWLDRALEVSPEDAALVTARRAELLLAQGKAAEAEQALRPLAASARAAAVPVLIEALLRQGKNSEADELVHDAVVHAQPGDAGARPLRLAIARAMARAAAARGDDASAVAHLREALAIDPDDRTIQLALIYRELDADETAAAVALAEKLRREHPTEPEVLLATAHAQQQDGRPEAALATLGALDAASLSQKARALRDQLTFATRVRAALAVRATPRQKRLEELEAEAVLDAEALAILADGWVKADKRQRALTTVRRALAAGPSRGARLRAAGVLVQLGAPGELDLVRLLDELDGESDLTTRERHQLTRARIGLAVRQVDEDRRAGEYRRGFLRLEPSLQATPEDSSLLAALARLQVSAGHPGAALTLYRKLVERDPDDLGLSEGAAFAAMASGQREQAAQLAAGALKLHPNEPRAYLLAGRIAVARGDDHLGRQLFSLGLERWRQLPAEPGEAHDAAGTGALIADARAQLVGEGAAAPDPEEEPPPVDRALTEEQHRIDTRYAPSLGAGVTFRYRSGDPGLSRLFVLEVPIVLQASPQGQYGRFSARIVPTYATAQATDLSDPTIADVFGTDGVFAPTTMPLRLSSDVGGVALMLRYDLRGFFAEVGSTPIGFHIVNVVGQGGWLGSFGPWSFGLRGFRAPVVDSVLSMAGLADHRTGLVWGGVTREGGQVDADYDPGDFAFHLYGAYAAYTGQRVATNHGGQYDLTAMWRLFRRPRHTVAVGLEIFIMHFADNLRFFTLGQGGYFSPQFFLFAGVPLTWELHRDAWTLRAGGAVGVNWYQEDPSPMFPSFSALQSLRTRLSTPGVQFHDGWFPGSEHVSAFGKVRLGVSHDIGTALSLEGSFDGQFGPAYSEILLLLALHHVFL
jgi:tetratricopeptide (TPR) repeat protein